MGADISGLVILDAISKLKKLLGISRIPPKPLHQLLPAVSFCSDGL